MARINLNSEDFAIRHGGHSDIYLAGDKAIKVLRGYFYSTFEEPVYNRANMGRCKILLEDEFQVGRDLFEGGVSVPKYYGVFRVKLDKMKNSLGLLMDRIDGENLENLRGKIDSNLWRRYSDFMYGEIQNARDIGFVLGDRAARNVVVSKRGELFLIDFEDVYRIPN